jgi:hypothetical protein
MTQVPEFSETETLSTANVSVNRPVERRIVSEYWVVPLFWFLKGYSIDNSTASMLTVAPSLDSLSDRDINSGSVASLPLL